MWGEAKADGYLAEEGRQKAITEAENGRRYWDALRECSSETTSATKPEPIQPQASPVEGLASSTPKVRVLKKWPYVTKLEVRAYRADHTAEQTAIFFETSRQQIGRCMKLGKQEVSRRYEQLGSRS